MSLHRTLHLACSECGHAQDATVWDSVNAQISPEGREAFFDGRINVVTCATCGHTAALAIPFLYHDMILQCCVQYFPPQAIEDPDVLGEFSIEGTRSPSMFGPLAADEAVLQKAGYMLKPHVVFSMREALTYVVFRENLAVFHSQNQAPSEETAPPDN